MQSMNHGGHEVFDVHEVLSSTVGMLNQYTLLREYVQDPVLLDILNRQYAFLKDEYNTTVESFQTGHDPSKPTGVYNMQMDNQFTYGLQAGGTPKKPMTSPEEINDEFVAGAMLGALKACASGKTMAALESTNPVVRRVLADSIPNCIEMAYEISLYQNKRGFYQVPQLAMMDMQQMLNKYQAAM